MDPRWDRIRVSLLQHVGSAEADQQLAELCATLHALSGCSCARDVITFTQQSKQQLEDASRSFIMAWHERLHSRETISACLMLCLWKRLTSVFYIQRSFWDGMEDELASELVRAFLNTVSDEATARALLVSETLVFRTEQRVIDTRRKELRTAGERRRRSQLPEWVVPPPRPCVEIHRFELTEIIEALGREADTAMDLLIEIFRADHDYDAVAARRGITRERVQSEAKRCLHRVRMYVEEKTTATAVFQSEISFSSGSLEIECANDNARDGGSNDDDDGDKSSSGRG